MTTREVERLADKTIETLHTLGWVRDEFQTNDGVCLSGAIRIARFGTAFSCHGLRLAHEDPYDPFTMLRSAILATMRSRFGYALTITFWNDNRAESVEDVILLVKEAVHHEYTTVP